MPIRPTRQICGWLFSCCVALVVLAAVALKTDLVRIPPPLHRRSAILFRDVTEESGIRFRHWNGDKGISTIAEQLGPGCACADFDGDGLMDFYLTNGQDRYGRGLVARNVFYRNAGQGFFQDVTEKSGTEGTRYGFGCVAADYDNDGCLDLYVTQWGRNVLYRNNGDGSFSDVTDFAGVSGTDYASDHIHTGAAFGDYDSDGDLDLYVCSYVDLQSGPLYCMLANNVKSSCHPSTYQGTPDILYSNNGDGKFVNVTKQSGVFRSHGKGLMVIWSDFYEHGRLDLFVANDGQECFLFRNRGDGTFDESALQAGIALATHGSRAMDAMGIDRADFNRDGHLDLLITDFQSVPDRLFRGEGKGRFTEVSIESGIGLPTMDTLGFGAGFADFDNDSWEDVFFANGHVYPEIDQASKDEDYKQLNQVFRNQRDGTFKEISREAGSGLEIFRAGRGAAFGDYDNDGKIDVLVGNVNDPPTLLHNISSSVGNYVRFRLESSRSNREAIGAVVRIRSNGRSQLREVRSGSSYMSHNDSRVHFGLGNARHVDDVELVWPDGTNQRIRNIAVNQSYTLRQQR